MELTNGIKDRVIERLLAEFEQKAACAPDKKKYSQAEFARMIAVRHEIKFDKAVLPQIKKVEGRNYSAINEISWLILARHYNVLNQSAWNTARTKAYIKIQAQLGACQKYGIWQVLCDRAGIGKSYAAVEYARAGKNVFYVDCSEFPSKGDFISCLAGQFGLEKTGSYNKLWREVTNELLLLDSPLLILDEFGDCADAVVTLMKGLYNKANAGDRIMLGCYFMGADNLQKNLIDGRRTKKPSYAEFWSRFNEKVTNLGYEKTPGGYREELRGEIEKIANANLPEAMKEGVDKVVEETLRTGAVRATQKEIAKLKMLGVAQYLK